ncbi:hypothetical protein RCOM_0699750 [Ricinus communis]|uniref:MYND-type domain-containing protein n=1 Tax=Ricinus communis TaxID=3988 RepID=B9S2I1_RICCO|nr:hypothetical protein RCOM_0699750 [Ricinus communis]
MECAAKGRGRRCIGPPTRRCARCSAVAYCSVSHQILHWSEHKEECERLEQQMKRADDLNDFPFTFTPQLIFQEENRCSFLSKREIHGLGMWICECSCGASLAYSDCLRSKDEGWNLSGDVCPCRGPVSPISKHLSSWMDYYEWRCIPLHSPVALLLHWEYAGVREPETKLTYWHGDETSLWMEQACRRLDKVHIVLGCRGYGDLEVNA